MHTYTVYSQYSLLYVLKFSVSNSDGYRIIVNVSSKIKELNTLCQLGPPKLIIDAKYVSEDLENSQF